MTISVYMGGKKLQKGEYKNYICVSDYVSELVNEVYYSKIDEYNKRKKLSGATTGEWKSGQNA